MNVTIFGTGYVGLVTGACLADGGHDVVCVDVDEAKVAMLERGEVPIFEPGLNEVVSRNVRAGRLAFTTDAARGVAHGLFQFIAVGTPPARTVPPTSATSTKSPARSATRWMGTGSSSPNRPSPSARPTASGP